MRILLPGAASDPARRGSRAARNFKRKVLQEDIIREVKRHAFYLKPGQKLRVKQALARKRNRKKARRETE
jgi:small subunit ribosomal protein S21